MGMFGPRLGSCWLRSKEDPRWNFETRAYVGGFEMPKECKDKIEELKKKLGKPPRDLEWGYMKY
jgi:hypothetical protein